MECREVREYLPAYLDEPREVRHLVEGHLATCAGCRRELEAYRELADSLATLGREQIDPPAWLARALVETVSERAHRRAAIRERTQTLTSPKVALAAGAVAAGVAGAIFISRKRRRRGVSRRARRALAEA